MTDVPLFFINLDRATDRADHMWREIDALGLRAQTERISAIDAKTDPLRDAFRRNFFSLCYQLEDGLRAANESHRKAWMRMLELGVERAVFLEDDMIFSPRFGEAIADIAASPVAFDAVKLDGVPFDVRVGAPVECGSVAIRPLCQVLFSAGAYMLSRAGAERMLEDMESYNLAVDLELFAPREDWTMYQVDPALAVQGMLLSESERDKLHPDVSGSSRQGGKLWFEVPDPSPSWFQTKCYIQNKLTRDYPNKLWRDRAFVRKGGSIERMLLQDDFSVYRW